MSTSTNILVLGAGELGKAVIHSLLAYPSVTVTAFLRRPNPELGVPVVLGDIAKESVEELAKKFEGYDTVISCTGFVAGGGTQMKILDAIFQTHGKVKRFVPWQFGVDYDVIGRKSGQDVFDEQLDVRDRLRAQTSVEWIIVSTGLFTSFLFEPAFGLVSKDRSVVRALGSWDTRVTVMTAEDIGRMTASILLEHEHRNEVMFIAGETITYARLATIVQSVKGVEVTKELWDKEKLQKDLEEGPDDPMAKYRIVFASEKGIAWDAKETYNWKKGSKMTDVESWLKAEDLC